MGLEDHQLKALAFLNQRRSKQEQQFREPCREGSSEWVFKGEGSLAGDIGANPRQRQIAPVERKEHGPGGFVLAFIKVGDPLKCRNRKENQGKPHGTNSPIRREIWHERGGDGLRGTTRTDHPHLSSTPGGLVTGQ